MLKSAVRSGKTIVFAGLGNVLRRDDGVGVYLAQHIRPHPSITILNVEVGIENHIGKINSLRPDLLILMDCVFFNRQPGYCQLIEVDRLADFTTNTHNISLKRISEFISARSFILGIQPAEVNLGEGLTRPVINRANQLIKKINSCLYCD